MEFSRGAIERSKAWRKDLEKARLMPYIGITRHRGMDRENSVPQLSIFNYAWSMPGSRWVTEQNESSEVKVGDEVWVKPGKVRCWLQWDKKTNQGEFKQY